MNTALVSTVSPQRHTHNAATGSSAFSIRLGRTSVREDGREVDRCLTSKSIREKRKDSRLGYMGSRLLLRG